MGANYSSSEDDSGSSHVVEDVSGSDHSHDEDILDLNTPDSGLGMVRSIEHLLVHGNDIVDTDVEEIAKSIADHDGFTKRTHRRTSRIQKDSFSLFHK